MVRAEHIGMSSWCGVFAVGESCGHFARLLSRQNFEHQLYIDMAQLCAD